MLPPCVSVSIESNPKRETVHSSALMQCLREVTEGAWNIYLDLDPVERRWLAKIEIAIALMDNGTTPCSLEVALHISESYIVFRNAQIVRFTVNQITGKNPSFIISALKNQILSELCKAVELELVLCAGQMEAVKATLERIGIQRESIRRMT